VADTLPPIVSAASALKDAIDAFESALDTATLPDDLANSITMAPFAALPGLLDQIAQTYAPVDEARAPAGFREAFRRSIVYEFKFEDD
jgi:hypothetical protein